MAMHQPVQLADPIVPITGRRLALPPGPIFKLRRSTESDYEIGEFRAWAGYKNLGVDEATDGLAHFQQVVSFAGTDQAGRTGVHAHFAHAHIVIPTSGHGTFSYDGVITEAVPGMVIHQHGGTIHDQFAYSYAAASDAENRMTPQSVEPPPAGAPPRSFGFLELFVPKTFANVEIVPPAEVTDADQRTAWDHPYHSEGAGFFVQAPDDPGAAYRPVALRGDLEARDAGTWAPSGRLVATWIIRPASGAGGEPLGLDIPGERDGLEILYMVAGSARFARCDGEIVSLGAGDTLTCSQGVVCDPFDVSADMRLVRFFIAARAQALRERTPEEIERLEALGPRIITHREVRSAGDTRPVNALHGG
jgi:mannose-6-phosphate isomerase-like protein (cupin superfamily)